MEQKSRNYLSRASLLLGAFSQHIFGDAIQRARMLAPSRGAPAACNPAGSKPAGTRGMHSPEMLLKFRPMAHGKLGKKSGQGKRDQRMRQRGYAQFVADEARFRQTGVYYAR
jgi:hypothetical protein